MDGEWMGRAEGRATGPSPSGSFDGGRVVRWTGSDLVWGIIAALVAFFLVLVGLVTPAVAIWGQDSSGALALQAVAVIVWDASIVAIVFWFVRRRGSTARDIGYRLPDRDARPIWDFERLFGRSDVLRAGLKPDFNPRFYLLCSVLSAYVTAYAVVLVYSLVVNALGIEALQPSQQIPDSFFDHGWVLGLIGVSVVVTAPFAEETFFRGFLFGGLRRGLVFLPAAAISGVLFALSHTDPGLVIPFSCVGMVLAYAYERSGSVFTSMGTHFVFNLVSFAVLVFVPGSR